MKKIAIVGCGRISYKHVEAIIANEKIAKLVAVSDIMVDNAEKRATEYVGKTGKYTCKPTVFKEYKEMLKVHSDIDIVSICTESGYHAEIAINCMKQGKHVIVEKPMALSISDADEMIETADKMGVKLGVCFQNRFNPPIQKLRKALEDGRFGKIISVTARVLWNRNKTYYEQAPWRGTYNLDGGCLMNQCTHNIDLLQWMLNFGKENKNSIKWINGDVSNHMHPYIEAEDYGSIQIKYDNGAIGNIEGTVCVFPENLEETLMIIGEKGIAEIGGIALNTIKVWRFEDGVDNEEDVKKQYSSAIENVYGHGHAPFYKDFIEAALQNKKPYIDGKDGKKALEIILAAYKSSHDEARVNFPLKKDISSEEFKQIVLTF